MMLECERTLWTIQPNVHLAINTMVTFFLTTALTDEDWYVHVVFGMIIDMIIAPPPPAPLVGPHYQNASQQTAPLCALWPIMTRPQECWWTKETLQASHQVDS